MIELGTLRAETYFDVSKALPKGQLSEGHAQELIQAREGLHFERASIAGDATTKGGQRKMLHQLRKHQLASVHRCPPRSYAPQGRRTGIPSSNRDQKNLPLTHFSSIIYGRQQAQRWDTTVNQYDFTGAPAHHQRQKASSSDLACAYNSDLHVCTSLSSITLIGSSVCRSIRGARAIQSDPTPLRGPAPARLR